MTPTVDVEITSTTTARATLADTDVPPMELDAPDRTALSAVVHTFLHNLAKQQNATVEVIYRTGKDTRYLSVDPDGKAAERAPSVPLPIVPTDSESAQEPTTGKAAPEPATVALAGPLFVDSDRIDPTPTMRPAAASTRAAPRPAAASMPEGSLPAASPAPSPERQRQAPPAPGPSTGPLEALSQLSAPRVNLATSDPARLGVRGRLNALLGLGLTPKTASLEMRLRDAQASIARPLPDSAMVTVANVKGGVGKTPLAIGLAETMATRRGPATVTCLDLGEIGGSFADRVPAPPGADQDLLGLLAEAGSAAEVRPSTLARFLTRQPSGSDVLAGRPEADAPLSYDDASALGGILGRHRDVVVADTGNSSLSGSWRWAITAAHAIVVPVPLRRDAAVAAQRTLTTIAANHPAVLARTVVVITDGPGDAPMVETEVVDAFSALGVPVCRMPFEPLFASGERITLSQLRRDTCDALTVLAATVVDLMADAVD